MSGAAFIPLHLTVGWLTWRQLFAHKRLYVALGFAFAPLIITLIFRTVVPETATAESIRTFYAGLGRDATLGVILPLTAVVFGTVAFGGEIDDGTVVYLLVKPIARWRLVTTKYLVAVLSTIGLMVPGVFLPWLALRGPSALSIAAPLALMAGAMVGAFLYCALFVFLGVATRRSLMFGLAYVVGFEEVLSRGVPGIRTLSIREFAASIAQRAAPSDAQFGTALVTTANIEVVGLAILVGSLALAMWMVRRYQLAERA
jgi:ABC-2 type transport system permease protein